MSFSWDVVLAVVWFGGIILFLVAGKSGWLTGRTPDYFIEEEQEGGQHAVVAMLLVCVIAAMAVGAVLIEFAGIPQEVGLTIIPPVAGVFLLVLRSLRILQHAEDSFQGDAPPGSNPSRWFVACESCGQQTKRSDSGGRTICAYCQRGVRPPDIGID
jgi:hypothetical protein